MMKKIFVFLMIFVPLAVLLGACQALSDLDLGRENIPCGPLRHVGQPTPEHSQVITLTAWARSTVNICNMASIPVWAAQSLGGISIEALRFDVTGSRFASMINSAYEDDSAPDIYVGDYAGEVHLLAQEGKILPLDSCEDTQPQFATIVPIALQDATYENSHWAVPVDIAYNVLYFDRVKLRQLGWSDQRVESLAERIRSGQFTLEDLLITTQDAIGLGIVEPGYGYIPENAGTGGTGDFLHIYRAFDGDIYDHEMGRFVFSVSAFEQAAEFYRSLFEHQIRLKNFGGKSAKTWFGEFLRTDALAARQALFWVSATSDIPEFDPNVIYGKRPDVSEQYLEEVGIALFPSGIRGKPAKVHAFFDYWVLNSNLKSEPEKLRAACQIIASSLHPKVTEPHLLSSGRTTAILLPQDEPFVNQNPFHSMVYPFWENAWRPPYQDGKTDAYYAIIASMLERIATDEIQIGLAKSEIIAKLNHEFGTEIEVRP